MNYYIIPGIKIMFRKQSSPKLTVAAINDAVCEFFSVNGEDLKKKYRGRNVTYPRQVAMYLMRKFTNEGVVNIAGFFRRHHTTAIHAERQISDLITVNESVRNDIERLQDKIYATQKSR